MKPLPGVLRIFLYNWTTYLALILVVVLVFQYSNQLPHWLAYLVRWAAATSLAWGAVSLLVSWYVYDLSSLKQGAWLHQLLPEPCETWASIDVGLDAEVPLEHVLPGRCVARLDVFDASLAARSVFRARRMTPRNSTAQSCSFNALPLQNESCDAITLIFAAHEMRRRSARESLFQEATRCLRPAGRLVLLEHARDIPNFMAFGPGFLHFQPYSEWLSLASVCGLTVHREIRVTPFVRAIAFVRTEQRSC